jgi:hypothetical protein
MKSTAGARFLARERDIAEGRVVEMAECPPMPPRGPLVERLSLSSLRAVAGLFGWTLSEMERRYKWAG